MILNNNINGNWHVIFDLDGTVFDTEFEVSRITANICRENGMDISPERVFCEFAGLGAREKFEEIAKAEGAAFTYEEFVKMGEEHERRKAMLYYADSLPVVDHIPQTFETLHQQGFIMSVGSTNETPRQRLGLTKMGFIEYFNDRLYGPDLTEGRKKPDPAIFLLAMRENQTSPYHSIVVEDTEPGIIAGYRAGAFVVAYLDPRFGTGALAVRKEQQFKESGADAVIRGFKEFMDVLPTSQQTRRPERKFSPAPR